MVRRDNWRADNGRKNESVNSQTDAQEEVQSQDVEQETSEEQASTEQTDVNSDAQNESSSQTTSDVETTADEEENVDPKDEEIQQLKEQVKENEDKYLRLYAEFENYKRRLQKENQTMKNINHKVYLLTSYLRLTTSNAHCKSKVKMNSFNHFKRR